MTHNRRQTTDRLTDHVIRAILHTPLIENKEM